MKFAGDTLTATATTAINGATTITGAKDVEWRCQH